MKLAIALFLVSASAFADEKPREYTLHLTEQEVNVIWSGLMELPGKIADPTKAKVNSQFLQQQQDKEKK